MEYAGPPPVAIIDGRAITPDELSQKYDRTTSGIAIVEEDSTVMLDFLERYVDLRVKLMAAREAGYYLQPSLKEELDGYRNALGRPYLLDQEVIEPIVRDLFDKKQEILSVSHILTRVTPEAAAEDTLAAYNKLSSIRDSVMSGADFGTMALLHSEDPSASISRLAPGYEGFLGRFSAGRLVKPFEDMAYKTPVGEVSPVFRTQFGYHILTVHERAPMLPDIRLSHIMTRPSGAAGPDSLSPLERILAIKSSIDAGESFEAAARNHSEDPNSAHRGGDIGTFSYDNVVMDTAFSNAAFALKNIGDVSDIVTSEYGHHLIKLTGRSSLATYEEAFEDLKRTAARLPRMRQAEKELAQDVRSRHSVTVDTLLLHSLVDGIEPDSVREVLAGHAYADSADAVLVATLADSSFSLGQVSSYLADNPGALPNAATADEQVLMYVDVFLDDAAISFAARNLEQTDEAFAAMIREFEEGLVLFRFMEDSVWTATEMDTVGLMTHYEGHKDKYRFPDRKRILQLYSRNDSLLTDAIERLDEGMAWAELAAEIMADSMHALRMDTVMVEGVTNSVYDQALELNKSSRTDALSYRSGKIVLYFDDIELARQMTFSEARAIVITEHQETLEGEIVARLRSRYKVQTFPENLPGTEDTE